MAYFTLYSPAKLREGNIFTCVCHYDQGDSPSRRQGGVCLFPHTADERAVRMLLECFLVTARKRSLGQGNIFIGVCQEFCSQEGGGLVGWGGLGCPQGPDTPRDQTPPGLDPPDQTPQTRPPGPDTPRDQTPPRPDPLPNFFWHTVNVRAVRILLECILVLYFITIC